MRPSVSRFRPQAAMLWVYAGLLAGMGGSFALSWLPPGDLRVVVHLGIAFLMAALIVTVFMGLRSMGSLLRWFALGALLWLLFLIALTPADYLTR